MAIKIRSPSTGVVIGCSIGAIVIALLVALVFIWWRRRWLRLLLSNRNGQLRSTKSKTSGAEPEIPLVDIRRESAPPSPALVYDGTIAPPHQIHYRDVSRSEPMSPDYTLVTPFILPSSPPLSPPPTKRRFRPQRPILPASSFTNGGILSPPLSPPAEAPPLPTKSRSRGKRKRPRQTVPEDVRASWIPDERPELMDRDAFAAQMGELLDNSPIVGGNPFTVPSTVGPSSRAVHPFSAPDTGDDEQRVRQQGLFEAFRRQRASVSPSVETAPPAYDALSVRRVSRPYV